MDRHAGDAAATLDQLQHDRARLDEATRTPWWVPAGLALIAAIWVLSPALVPPSVSYALAVVGVLALLHGARRQTGLRASVRGPRTWALAALWLLLTMLAYSVALGLAAADLVVWVGLPAAAAAAVTYLSARTVDRWAREALRA